MRARGDHTWQQGTVDIWSYLNQQSRIPVNDGELNQELPFSLQLSWKMLTPLVQKPTKDITLTTNLKAGLTASELNIPKFKKVNGCSLPVL